MVSGKRKKTFLPQGPVSNRFPWDKSLKTSAVPPNLASKTPARRCAITHLSLVTGEKPVGPYWGMLPFRPPSAVHSAKSLLLHSHHRQLSERNSFCLLVRVIGFLLVNLGKVYAGENDLSTPQKTFCGAYEIFAIWKRKMDGLHLSPTGSVVSFCL